MKRSTSTSLAVWLALGIAGITNDVLADTIALTFTGGTAYDSVSDPLPNTIGWQFNLSAAVSVTKLGFFDKDGDGLAASHDVSIWNSAQNQVVSTSVSGTDTLEQGFRWASVSPVNLPAGTYRIGASIYLDDMYYSGTDTRTTAYPVSYDGGVYLLGNFGYPETIGYTNNGRFGPNFQIAPVPEPETYAMILGGFGLMSLIARRRKQNDDA